MSTPDTLIRFNNSLPLQSPEVNTNSITRICFLNVIPVYFSSSGFSCSTNPFGLSPNVLLTGFESNFSLGFGPLHAAILVFFVTLEHVATPLLRTLDGTTTLLLFPFAFCFFAKYTSRRIPRFGICRAVHINSCFESLFLNSMPSSIILLVDTLT